MEPVSVTVFRVRTGDARRGHENSDLGFIGGGHGS